MTFPQRPRSAAGMARIQAHEPHLQDVRADAHCDAKVLPRLWGLAGLPRAWLRQLQELLDDVGHRLGTLLAWGRCNLGFRLLQR